MVWADYLGDVVRMCGGCGKLSGGCGKGCLEGVVKAVWRVWGGCLEGVERLFEGCGKVCL